MFSDLLFDCSRVLEYAKIRTILQSIYSHNYKKLKKTNMLSPNISTEFKNSVLPTPSIDTSRLSDLSRDPTSMSESLLRVIVLPSYFILA